MDTQCQGGCGKVRSILHADDPKDWLCNECRQIKHCERKERKNAARRAKHQAYLDCGMKRVKGALGGTYYE